MIPCLNFRSFIFGFVCGLFSNTYSITDHTPLNDTATENWSWQNFSALQAWELVMAQFGCYRSIFQDTVWNWSWHNLGAIAAFSRTRCGTGHGTIWVLSQHFPGQGVELVMAQFGCYCNIFQDRVWNWSWHNLGAIAAFSRTRCGTGHGTICVLSQHFPGQGVWNWSWHNLGAIAAFSRTGCGTGHGTIWVLSQHFPGQGVELVMAQFGCYRSIFQDRVWNWSWHNLGAIAAFSRTGCGTVHGTIQVLSSTVLE